MTETEMIPIRSIFITLLLLHVCSPQNATETETRAPQNATETSTGSIGNDTEPAPKPCIPGISVGYMLIRKPNQSSIITVGQSLNVSWDWSITVKKIPTFVDVYVQLIAPGIRTTWKDKI